MNRWISLVAVVVLGFAAELPAQFEQDLLISPSETAATSGLRRTLSQKPFFGTESVLTLTGDYINSPKEDFETIGVWTTPLSLDELHGVVAGLAFGNGTKPGQWQLSYRKRLMVADS